jgi:hypothetical protein
MRGHTQTSSNAAIVNEICQLIESRYFDPAKALAMSEVLRRNRSAFDGIDDKEELAKALTTALFAASNDKHLKVLGGPSPLPELASTPKEAEELEASRNFGISKVEILKGNIGLLSLNGFARLTPEVAARIKLAFQFLDHTYGLVIDVTNSRGGDPATEAEIISYLQPEHTELDSTVDREGHVVPLFSREKSPEFFYGLSRPVVVTVSTKTFSAAEALPYDLQASRRAQIVGEQTAGGANAGRFNLLSNGLTLFVPEAQALNPITHGNWDGAGVTPDIQVRSVEAISVAHLRVIDDLIRLNPGTVKRAILEAGKTP